jgi:hypothetical protein
MKQAVLRLKKNQHLIVFIVVIFSASHAGKRQHEDLFESEITVDHIDWPQERQLVELTSIPRSLNFVNFDTGDKY